MLLPLLQNNLLGRTGSSSLTEGVDTLVATATIAVSATYSATEGADSLSGSGNVPVSSTYAATEGADTLSGTGNIPVSGSFTAAEDSDALLAAGIVSDPVLTGSNPDYKQGGWHDHSQDIWAYEKKKEVKKQQAVIKRKITNLRKKIVADTSETPLEASVRLQIEQQILTLQLDLENLSKALIDALREFENQKWLAEQKEQERLAYEQFLAEEARRIEEADIVFVMAMLAEM